MNELELKHVLEALLMSSAQPLSLERMQVVFDEWQKPTRLQLQDALNALAADYATRPIELKQLATGYCVQTRLQYAAWVARLFSEKPVKYSSASLETLAIIAYRQPVTRADIEGIRGVAVSGSILKSLLERDWIRMAGHRDVPGKPAVYVTTKSFLDYFNLTNLDDLPSLQQSVMTNE